MIIFSVHIALFICTCLSYKQCLDLLCSRYFLVVLFPLSFASSRDIWDICQQHWNHSNYRRLFLRSKYHHKQRRQFREFSAHFLFWFVLLIHICQKCHKVRQGRFWKVNFVRKLFDLLQEEAACFIRKILTIFNSFVVSFIYSKNYWL